MSTSKPLNEQDIAKLALLSNTRNITNALPVLSGWVLGGFGIGLGLFFAHIDIVSRFIYVTHVRFALLVFLLSVAAAVIANYLSTAIRMSLAVTDELEALGSNLQALGRPLDLQLFLTEYRRGLFPHVAWIASLSMQKVISGDVLFGTRFVAKMSQIQALLVFSQCLLALIALAGLAFGIKME